MDSWILVFSGIGTAAAFDDLPSKPTKTWKCTDSSGVFLTKVHPLLVVSPSEKEPLGKFIHFLFKEAQKKDEFEEKESSKKDFRGSSSEDAQKRRKNKQQESREELKSFYVNKILGSHEEIKNTI